jgi:hypothetical protein
MEFIQVRCFHNFAEVYEQTHEFIYFYNEERIHGSLGMRTPAEILSVIAFDFKVDFPETPFGNQEKKLQG